MNPFSLTLCASALLFCACSFAQPLSESSAWLRADVQQALVHEDAMLPVKSQILSPGKVEPRTVSMPGLSPFFLVGADEFSLQWLRARATDLETINAAGLAVEVRTVSDLARIRATTPALTILPVNGDDIARRLQIKHYPVLVTPQSLEQ